MVIHIILNIDIVIVISTFIFHLILIIFGCELRGLIQKIAPNRNVLLGFASQNESLVKKELKCL